MQYFDSKLYKRNFFNMKEISKNANFEDVETVMDRMMQIPIIGIGKSAFCDPNLIMDLRHDFIKRPAQLVVNCSQSTLANVDLASIRKAREEHLLQLELRRFEKQLQAARPKFHQLKSCKKNAIASSDDIDFWNSLLSNELEKVNENSSSKSHLEANEESLSENQSENQTELFEPNIKVTIKDKPVAETLEEKKNLVRKVFRIWNSFVAEKRYYRQLETEVKDRLSNNLLKRTISSWKREADKSKAISRKKKAQSEMSHERKIASFVNAIAKKQEELIKLQKLKKEVRTKSAPECTQNTRSTVLVRQVCVVESPAQSRLKAQQKIIEDQRLKLAKQRQIIEDLQLKEFQDQSRKMSDKTLEAAKDILDYCGPRTKRTLLQLMKEKGYSAKSEDKQCRVPNAPEFLTRMQSRAEARMERVKRAKEARDKRLEEEKRREELLQKEQEQERKQLQLEAQKEARRIRKKQEQQKLKQLENQKIIAEKCERFYQRLLLKNYFLIPFKFVLQLRKDDLDRASNFYNHSLLSRYFCTWKNVAKTTSELKISSATFFADKKLLSKVFFCFRKSLLETRNNFQVAQDFFEIKLLIRTFESWKSYAAEEQEKNIEKEKMALEHDKRRILKLSFCRWLRYLEIAEELRESERRKDELRAVVQQVIPDFDPKRRGVAID